MNIDKIVNEIIEATNTQVQGFDNEKLVRAIVSKFESEVRIDQCEKDKNMAIATIQKCKV